MTQTVVIVIPGIAGSSLVIPNENSGAVQLVWPNVATANPGNLASLLEQAGIVTAQLSTDYYALMDAIAACNSGIEILVNPQIIAAGAASEAQTCLPSTTSDVVIGFGYDWRVDITTSAKSLSSLISQVYTSYCAGDTYCALYIVAHSMGGLVARYAFESGDVDTTQTSSFFKGLITLGTPHEGAPLALAAITNEIPSAILSLLGMQGAQIESFTDVSAYDSTYELLPPSSYPYVYDSAFLSTTNYSTYNAPLLTALISTSNDKNSLTYYYGANSDSLTNANAFWGKLSSPGNVWGTTPLCMIYGSAQDTIEKFKFDSSSGKLWVSVDPTFDGDTIVPVNSASFSSFAGTTPPVGVTTFDAGLVSHLNLPSNPGVINHVTSLIYP